MHKAGTCLPACLPGSAGAPRLAPHDIPSSPYLVRSARALLPGGWVPVFQVRWRRAAPARHPPGGTLLRDRRPRRVGGFDRVGAGLGSGSAAQQPAGAPVSGPRCSHGESALPPSRFSLARPHIHASSAPFLHCMAIHNCTTWWLLWWSSHAAGSVVQSIVLTSSAVPSGLLLSCSHARGSPPS